MGGARKQLRTQLLHSNKNYFSMQLLIPRQYVEEILFWCCPSVRHPSPPTCANGIQNNLAQLFSIMRRCAILNICVDKVKVTVQGQMLKLVKINLVLKKCFAYIPKSVPSVYPRVE